MKRLLERKRAYIDTNIFIYVALKHPDFYGRCYSILEMLVSGVLIGYGSNLVLFELFGALSKINVEAAYEAARHYLDLPLIMLEPNKETLRHAREIAMASNTTYDSLHAALVAQNNVEVVVTEDTKDWGRVLRTWPKVKGKLGVGDLVVLSPTKGVLKL